MDLRLRSNEARRPAPPQDRPSYFQNTLCNASHALGSDGLGGVVFYFDPVSSRANVGLDNGRRRGQHSNRKTIGGDMQTAHPSRSRAGSWLRVLAVGRNPKTTLIRAAFLAVFCVVVFKWFLLPVRVAGISMEPAYADHSFNFVNRLSYLTHAPRRGDVVGIRLSPPDQLSAPHIMYLKRIIGLPGESVAFDNGRVLINGQPLVEPYETWLCDWSTDPVALGPDEYFVVGDNRTMPKEEHTFGRAARSRIVGRALL